MRVIPANTMNGEIRQIWERTCRNRGTVFLRKWVVLIETILEGVEEPKRFLVKLLAFSGCCRLV